MAPTSSPTNGPLRPALHVAWRGAGPPLVLAHGFTQTGQAWGPLSDRLAAHHRIGLVDLPGHGRSSELAVDLDGGARLLGDAGGHASYLGYSMGARFCLHLALARPDLVERLVLVSGTAGIDDPAERDARRRSDEALADRLAPTDGSPPSDSVAEFVTRWLESPLFASLDPDSSALEARLANTAAGLAASLRLSGTGTQQPLWDRLGELRMPVLVVTGATDTKFTAIGRRLCALVGPNAVLVEVHAAGHAVHLERPDEVADLVLTFLASTGPG